MIRLLALVFLCTLQVKAQDFSSLLKIIKKDYTQRQENWNTIVNSEQFFWEIVSDYPYFCEEDSQQPKEKILVDGHTIFLLKSDQIKVQIYVMSYIKKDAIDSKVYRRFSYQLNSDNQWIQSEKPKRMILSYDPKLDNFECE